MTGTNRRANKNRVGVQYRVVEGEGDARIREPPRRHLSGYGIDIYWGPVQQFVSELHKEWRAHNALGDGEESWV